MANILGKSWENHKAQFPKLSFCLVQKSLLRHYYIGNVKDGIQIGVYKINKESVAHSSQFVSLKVQRKF